MQNTLQNLQQQYNIYNSEIEPEHEADYYCMCPIHNYKRMKWNRYGVQDMWSYAVMYPGEHTFLAYLISFLSRLTLFFCWGRREGLQ